MGIGRMILILVFALAAIILLTFILFPSHNLEFISKGTMKITSVFENTEMPDKYTCNGENINPPLDIAEVPEGTKSLVLIVDDPDAPAGTWVHWVVWNIKPDTVRVEEGSVPENAVQGTNDFKKTEYVGPCPPSGTHRYFFKIYALDTELQLEQEATKSEVEAAMQGHILSQEKLVGLYSKK
jgi:hypothetical protein